MGQIIRLDLRPSRQLASHPQILTLKLGWDLCLFLGMILI